jgi:dihydrofolate synthase/folylpolyglutamate synthase
MTCADSDAIDHLFSLRAHGIKLGLDAIAACAAACGNPQHAFRTVHVAGTNGKGSTCAFIESILSTAGYSTGCFTSPHLVNYRERFRIDRRTVPDASWRAVYADLKETIASHELTFFEASMLIACELFRRHDVEWAILETGMGGRFDATTICRPDICVITRIDMDHRQYLGNTLTDIAFEKLGIVKPHVPCVMLRPEDEKVRRLAHTVTTRQHAPLQFVSSAELPSSPPGDTGPDHHYTYKGIHYRLPYAGTYQAENIAVALEACLQLQIASPAAMGRAIEQTRIPGRFHVAKYHEKPLVLDGAHNLGAVHALIDTLGTCFSGMRICVVTGMMQDKDYTRMLRTLGGIASVMIYTAAASSRACPARTLAMHHPYPDVAREIVETVPAALSRAYATDTDCICVTGSLYIVGEAMNALSIDIDTLPRTGKVPER